MMSEIESNERVELVIDFCRETESSLDKLDACLQTMKYFVYDLDFKIKEYVMFCMGLQVETYLESLRCINRVVHTVKGVSGFIELNKINAYCHSVEELTLNLSKGTIYLNPRAFKIIEDIPIILNRFLEVAQTEYTDESVSIEKELAEIENCTRELLGLMGGKVIHLESIHGIDKGRVRNYRKDLKVTIDLGLYDSIIQEFQAFAQETVSGLQAQGMNFMATQEIRHGLVAHLDQLILSAQGKIVLSRYPRLVSDLSTSLGKKIVFKVVRNEADARPDIWDKCHNALVHLVRNSVDHGIESPKERTEQGKNIIGNIHLSIYEDFRNIFVVLEDDGRGIDPEIVAASALAKGIISPQALEKMDDCDKQRLIFTPEFSTRTTVNDISGRGVGMDAVLKEIEGNLNGRVHLSSQKGKGTRFTLEIPKTETLSECIRFGTELYNYAVPVMAEVEYIECNPRYLNHVFGQTPLYTENGIELPLLNLFSFLHPNEYMNIPMDYRPIIKFGDRKIYFGLVVPHIFGQERIKIDRRRILRKIMMDEGLVFGYGITDPITVVLDLDYLYAAL